MESQKMCAEVTPQKQSIIEDKLSQIAVQDKILEELFNDAYTAIGRLRTVGHKLNANAHPDNKEQALPAGKPMVSGDMPYIPINGIVGRLEEIISDKQAQIKKWSDQVWPSLCTQINYIEEHI